MEQGRRYRNEQVHVKDWESFKKVWKKFDFLKKLDSMTIENRKQELHKQYNQLLKDPVAQCYVMPGSLKQEHLDLMIEVAKSQEFTNILEYEHQAFYLDNPKQLVVYKKRSSVSTYLGKYRPTQEFKKLFQQILQISKQYQKLIIERNIMISNEEQDQNIQKISGKIAQFVQKILEPKLLPWRQVVTRMFKDFKSQAGKFQIMFMGFNSLLTKQITQICKDHELYISNRYEKISSYDQYRDILITKYDRSQENYSFDDKTSSNLSQQAQQHNEKQKLKIQQNFDQILNEKNQVKISRPKDIQNVIFKGYEKEGLKFTIFLQSSGTHNPVQYILAKQVIPKQLAKQVQQKTNQLRIQAELDRFQYDVTMPSIHSGCCIYQFVAGNSAGVSRNQFTKRVWAQGTISSQGNICIDNHNRDIYLIGQNQQGLIPNWSPQAKDETKAQTIIVTTGQEWQKFRFQCADFSVSSHGTICNTKGDVASWGRMFYFDEEGLNQDPKDQEQQDDDLGLTKINNSVFRVENPSLILSNQMIRKVSCGQGYCLMADSFGRAWSFGINTFGQLGLQHTDQNANTQEPTIIKFFSFQKIFVTDVAASYFGASFAIDNVGKAYRWGTNQVDQSIKPVKDSFNNIINFEYPDIVAVQSIPIEISNKIMSQKIKSIHPGVQFVLALAQTNKLYGWGKTKYFGINQMQNSHFQTIQNICNPILINKNIIKVSVGKRHCVALNENNQLFGWGESEFFSLQNNKQFASKPTKIRQNYQGIFVCGPDFTVYQQKDNRIRIIGNKKIFKAVQYKLPCKPIKIKAGQGVVIVMGDKLQQKQQKNQKQQQQQKKPETIQIQNKQVHEEVKQKIQKVE